MSKVLIPMFDVRQASCSPDDTATFFPEGGDFYKGTREAKQICSGCPLLEDCLNFAIANKEEWGIWGGATAQERLHLRKYPSQKAAYTDSLRRTKGRRDIVLITDENIVSWGDDL